MNDLVNRQVSRRARRRRKIFALVEHQRQQDGEALRVPGPPKCLRDQLSEPASRNGEPR